MYLVGQRYNYVGEDEENWDTISLSSFNAIMFYSYAFYKFVLTYHVVWGYYIIVFTILVRCNVKHVFLPAKKSIKRGELGHRKEKCELMG